VRQPKGSSFWYSKLDHFVTARPDYGIAVEPVRSAAAAKRFENADASDADVTDHRSDDSPSVRNPVETEEPEPSDDKPLDLEIRATIDSIQANLAASMADLASSRTLADEEAVSSVEIGSGAPPVCKLPRGCRYTGCPEQGDCLAQPAVQQHDQAAA
jgi:hypothetical protein